MVVTVGSGGEEQTVQQGDAAAIASRAREVHDRLGMEQALPLWRSAAEAGSLEALHQVARAEIRAGRAEDGKALLEQCARRGHGGAAWELNVLTGRSQERPTTREVVETAIATGDASPAMQAAEEAFRQGEVSEAERLLECAHAFARTQAGHRLAWLHIERGDPGRALHALGEASDSTSELWRGRAHAAQGALRQARRAFNHALAAGDDPAPAVELGDLAWSHGDRARAEQAYCEAEVRGDRTRLSRIAVIVAARGDDVRPLLARAARDDARTILLAAARYRANDREGGASGLCGLQGVPPTWALDAAQEELRALAPTNATAALCCGLALHAHDPEASDSLRAAFTHAESLGSPYAAEWLAYLEPDESRKRELLVDLEAGDRTGWSSYMLASMLFDEGDRDQALPHLRRSADLGWIDALTDQRLHETLGVAERVSLLQHADRLGSRYAAEQLTWLLSNDRGTGSRACEAAASRADLRRSGLGADWLGNCLYARFGAVDIVEKAWARAERRGQAAGALNLGALYAGWNKPILAADQYQRAIAMGNDEGHAALAELLWAEGKHGLAFAQAEAADATAPNWRSALVLGDILMGLGNPLAAIDHYIRADALGSLRAPIELADLWPHDVIRGRAEALAALDRAERRLTDDTHDHWSVVSPEQRKQFLGRVISIRRKLEGDSHFNERSSATGPFRVTISRPARTAASQRRW